MFSPILVVGSFVQDLTFFVGRFPAAGETLTGKFVTGPGGKGSNQAVAAARAGVQTAFFGAVGEDAFGDGAELFLNSEGIERHLLRIPDAGTGTAGIIVNAEGQNSIVVALGASEKFGLADVPPALLEAAQIVVLQLEIHLDTVRDVLQAARRLGKTTLLNPAPMNPDLDFAILSDVDIFIPNETELVAIVKAHPALALADFSEEKLHALAPDDLQALCRRLQVPTVIVTLGKKGAFISRESGFEFIPALQNIPVVDTTGAGDAFVGGFAAGLILFGGDISQAARHGTVVAGLSVTKLGTAPAMPTQAEIAACQARFSQ